MQNEWNGSSIKFELFLLKVNVKTETNMYTTNAFSDRLFEFSVTHCSVFGHVRSETFYSSIIDAFFFMLFKRQLSADKCNLHLYRRKYGHYTFPFLFQHEFKNSAIQICVLCYFRPIFLMCRYCSSIQCAVHA